MADKKITVWIECSQVVYYNQQVQLTDKEFEVLNELDADDVAQDTESVAFNILQAHINSSDVFDADQEYLSVIIKKNKP